MQVYMIITDSQGTFLTMDEPLSLYKTQIVEAGWKLYKLHAAALPEEFFWNAGDSYWTPIQFLDVPTATATAAEVS